ncbi:MAG TPA: phenylacetate-CoA oxygenase subunit PaaJ [Saprospiraceae bacterium]|jgi:ring-1,2-phenylacetyl-CoA epoxidase subunit PaaD|nr:phenylacetate-CoA oxygenase subunit PaaJ [Saprospiraceae bacterium]HRO07435.1 phenylacetate-CoA oxygenase subunit PaaJ [Saprospiraceae bacterium]HRP40718.1 phenylacetate-CoA oxygenase subunit PaaJ [Saprospiraceae bacterium]
MTKSEIYKILSEVADPEIPVISIEELGILRDVKIDDNNQSISVFITPTYNGCPAMDMISFNIRTALTDAGITDFEIISLIEPAWTTDWISDAGRQKLLDYGIAPPAESSTDTAFLKGKSPVVACPQCGSVDTEMVSRFGSTPCKALYRCLSCQEPFDYFKCH